MAKLSFLFVFSVLLYSCGNEKPPKLPILGNADILYKTVDGKEVADTIYPTIPAFTFLNQDSVTVTNESYKNRVWVVEFFFATCPTICPIMNVQFKKLNEETKKLQKHIQYLSLSINPKNDLTFVLTK